MARMTRFQKEISGALGDFWVANAKKEVARAVEWADKDAIVEADGAIKWVTSGNYIPDDFCEKLEYAGYNFSREATATKREAQTEASIKEYIENYRGPSEEEMAEMRAVFGTGTVVVDVISGAKIQL